MQEGVCVEEKMRGRGIVDPVRFSDLRRGFGSGTADRRGCGRAAPLGVFRINGKHANWGTGFGTRFLSIDCPWGKYGIHGTNRPGSIGWNASHGCIRMLNRDVEELYPLVQIGTKVIIERSSFGNLADGLRVLRPGDRGSDVYELQLRLRNAGCYWGFPDGVVGEATRRALLCFRKECSLPEGDTADWAVYAALGMELFE